MSKAEAMTNGFAKIVLVQLNTDKQLNVREHEAIRVAIKALEQQTCEDAVSRKAVNTLVDELARAINDERCYMSRGRDTSTIIQDILDLQSVIPQTKWIPVSEPPKEVGEYITTVDYEEYGLHSGQRNYYGIDGWDDAYVIAWMPLPEPYKVDKEVHHGEN